MTIGCLLYASVIETIIAYQVFRHFLILKSNQRWRIILSCLGLIFLLTVSGYIDKYWFTTISCIFFHIIFSSLLFKSNLSQRLLLSIVIVTIGIMAEFMSAFFISLLFKTNVNLTLKNPYFMLSIYVLSKSMAFLIARIIIVFFPTKNYKYFDRISLVLFSFPLLAIINEYYILYISFEKGLGQTELAVGTIIGLGLMLLGIAILLIYDAANKKKELEHELFVSKMEIDANDNLFRLQKRNIDEMRSTIHDFKNELLNLKNLYSSSDASVESYYKMLMDSLNDQIHNQMIDVNNSVFSSILQRTQMRCVQLNIHLNLKIDYFELGFLNPIDTSILFDNALDNAISACTGVACTQKRNIRIQLFKSQTFLILSIKNTHANKLRLSSNSLITTKENKSLHGVGIKNMKEAAQKYGGDITYSFSDSEFSLVIRLQEQIASL